VVVEEEEALVAVYNDDVKDYDKDYDDSDEDDDSDKAVINMNKKTSQVSIT